MPRRPFRFLVAAVALAAAALPAGAAGSSSPATAKSAAVAVYVSASGSDSACGANAPKRPCATFARAFQLAGCGGTVTVAAGAYPAQTVPQRSGSCGQYTTFAPADKAVVTLNDLDIQASYVRIQGTETTADAVAGRRIGFDVAGGVGVEPGSGSGAVVPDHVVVARVNAKGAYIGGASNVTLSGMNLGPLVSCIYGDSCADDFDGGFHSEDIVVIQARRDRSGMHTSTAVTITGSYLHDLTKVPESQYPESGAAHSDCIQLYSWNDIAIVGNRFHNCADTNIFAGYADGDAASYTGLRVDRNVFDPVGSYSYWGAQFPCTDMTFRRNVVNGQDVRFYCTGGAKGTPLVEQNVFPVVSFGACDGVTRRDNFYVSPSRNPVCDPSEVVGRATVRLTAASYRAPRLRVQYLVLAAQPLRLELRVFSGRKRLAERITSRSATTASGLLSVGWRNRLRSQVTRVCVRASDATRSVVATSCARPTG